MTTTVDLQAADLAIAASLFLVAGAVVFGLSLARDSEITARNGRIVQGNFINYRVLRFGSTPDTRIHLVDSTAPPAGVGEPGVPPIAPAVANALFAATGKRFRELPLGRELDLTDA